MELTNEELEKGVKCPCCNQFSKIYKRQITSSMAWALILIYKYFKKNPESEWVHIQNYLKGLPIPAPVMSGDISKLRFWGLLFPKVGVREDKSDRVGLYKITDRGKEFVENKIYVPKYVSIYNNEALKHSQSKVNIKEALKNKFNYEELMKTL